MGLASRNRGKGPAVLYDSARTRQPVGGRLIDAISRRSYADLKGSHPPLNEEAKMSTMNRREALRSLLTGALQTAGTVVLTCSALPAAAAQGNQGPPTEGDLQERADRLASEEGAVQQGQEATYGAFGRGGFANGGGGGGGFRRGGFANGGGGFRRGGWVN